MRARPRTARKAAKFEREGPIHISNVKLVEVANTEEKKAGKSKKAA